MTTYKLIFMDDNMHEGENDPFVRIIKELNQDAEIHVFTEPDEGLAYIMANLNSKMIVFLDCKFENYSSQGIDILASIRDKTSLLYIIMMSANNIQQMEPANIIKMINEEYIWFFDRNANLPQETTAIIKHIKKLWNVRFDCVLEEWINRHPEDSDKFVFKSNNSSYTWSDILHELRMQTETGKLFEQLVHEFYIYQYPNQK